jgi:excisionase family DNA binding protein
MMKSTQTVKRLYTLDEAATYLGRSTWSVRHLIWKGLLPQVRPDKRVQIDVRDMDEFIEKYKDVETR